MIKLFTHTDLDGIGCAVLAKLNFKDNVDIEYCNYNEINQAVERFLGSMKNYSNCFITDISINEELAERIDKLEDDSCNFYLLDHHPTALGLNKYPWCTVSVYKTPSIKTCGTELFYDWLIENDYFESNTSLEKFVNIVRDYDTWRWTELGKDGLICKQINDLYYLYGKDDFINWCLQGFITKRFPELRQTEKFVLKLKQKEVDLDVNEKNKEMIVKQIQGYQCGIVFAERNISEIGNKLANIHEELDIIVLIDMTGKISYRTIKENINLSEFAKVYGGGGHPKAAGSQFDREKAIRTILTTIKLE